MTAAEAKRAEKLQEMLIRLNAGEHIQNRMLQTWLTPEQYAAMLDHWQNQQVIRKNLADKPEEIERYEELLRQAIFLYNKGEGNSGRLNVV